MSRYDMDWERDHAVGIYEHPKKTTAFTKEIIMDKFFKAVGVLFTGFTFVVMLAALGAYPTKWVVNYLFTPAVLTSLFGGALTFWKALALNYIGGALFKSTASVSK